MTFPSFSALASDPSAMPLGFAYSPPSDGLGGIVAVASSRYDPAAIVADGNEGNVSSTGVQHTVSLFSVKMGKRVLSPKLDGHAFEGRVTGLGFRDGSLIVAANGVLEKWSVG